MRGESYLNRIGLPLLTALLVLRCVPLLAQYTTADLGGTVTDSSGAAVPDAKVTVRSTETGFTQNTVSSATGAFLFPRLRVGAYELRVAKEGFTAYLQSGITLAVDQAANVSVALQVGQVSNQVTVEAETELVTTRTATGGQVVAQLPIVELPLNGRRPERLMYLAAGTLDSGRNSCRICGQGGVYPGEETPNINGAGLLGSSSGGQVNFQMDGADHNDTYLNTGLPFPNPDAVQEFSLLSSNFSAEYGNAGGGVVNIVTRSGTNDIHGSAFEFLRNGDLNARQFFAPTQDALKRNQFGGSVGAPIRKNKLFVFGNYQGTRVRNVPTGQVQFVPTQAQRSGDFSGSKQLVDPVSGVPFPNNQIPASLLSPVSQYFLKQIPLPNGPGGQLTFPGAPIRQTEDQFMTKADYLLNKQQISGHYFYTNFSAPPGQVTGNVLADPNSGNQVKVQNVAINHTYTVSPTLLFNTTFGYNRQTGGSLSSAPFSFHDAGSSILGPQDSTIKAPPELSLSVTGGFSISTNHFGDFNRSDYTMREVGTKIKGAHEIKFGGEAVRVSNVLLNTYQMAGSFTFNGQLSGSGLADFLYGEASSFSQGGGEFKNLLGTKWGMFVQDDWRVNQRLTLNIGLRWDPFFPFYDRKGRVVCFQPNTTQHSAKYPNAPLGFLYGGDPGCPTAGFNSNIANFEPRLGFAYRLTQDGKTSIRGGAGIYYTPLPSGGTYNGYADTAPFAGSFSFNGVSFQDPYGSKGLANPFPSNFGPQVPGPSFVFAPLNAIINYFPLNYRIPEVTTWSLRIERQIGKDWVASVAYIGNKGTYLPNGLQQNPAIYYPGASAVANTQQRRLYPTIGSVNYANPGANSEYQAVQLNLEKRLSRGFTVLANYARSKSLDNLSAINPFTVKNEHSLSQNDIPNNFKLSGVWQVPGPKSGLLRSLLGGWEFSPVMTWQSGFPFSVTSGVDNSFSGINSDRSDYLGGGSAQLSYGRSHGQEVLQWFDTTKFGPNAPGTFGSSGRYILRGPRFFNTDLGILKGTKVTERVNLQFRAEFFDLFNNVNFQLPNSNMSSSQVGRITSVVLDNFGLPNSERIIQFGLKISF
jgi:hypothetical protein